MRDRDAFLAAILAQPADDLPRLVFADWLDEHGDADRAEFIRLQCAAARGELSAAAVHRMAELEAAHRPDWLGSAGRGVFHAEFRRGFVEHAVLPAADFLRHGPALRRQTPLRSVALLGARHLLPDLLDGPHLHGLAALHLTGARLGTDGVQAVRALAAAPALAGLTTLRLGQNDLGDAAAAALARGPYLSTLTTLVLDDNAIGDTGAWELARSPSLVRLTTLSLTANEIGPTGVAALRGSRHLRALTQLDVSDQRSPAGRWLLLSAAK
jgi:uncharacterized protein (TIGR02996 family)